MHKGGFAAQGSKVPLCHEDTGCLYDMRVLASTSFIFKLGLHPESGGDQPASSRGRRVGGGDELLFSSRGSGQQWPHVNPHYGQEMFGKYFEINILKIFLNGHQ